jgi:hypothetical protein
LHQSAARATSPRAQTTHNQAQHKGQTTWR